MHKQTQADRGLLLNVFYIKNYHKLIKIDVVADYYDIAHEQSTKNVLLIKPNSKVSFDLLYEDPPNNIDLITQKFLTQVRTIIDLSATPTQNLTAEITSPNYPRPYPNSVDVTWWIHAPTGDLISLYVATLELEECCDRLTIHDGISNKHPVIGYLTGNGTNVNENRFVSSSNDIFIQFTSDCSLTMRGFKGFLNTISRHNSSSPSTTTPSVDSCSGTDYLYVYPYSTYYLSSPGYPYQNYPNYLNCAWRLQVSSYSYVIKLEVLDLELEKCCDSVTLYDGSSSYYSPIIRLPNDSNSMTTFYSSGVYMYIEFKSDGSVNRKGFNFRYTATSPPTAIPTSPDYTSSALNPYCTNNYYYHIYSNNYGYIRSPNYPYSYYTNCRQTWSIESLSYNYIIQLQVQEFSLSYGDAVTVYDGYSLSYPILRVLTGSYSYIDIKSTGKYMYIVFTSDGSYQSSGFQLRYQSTYKTTSTTEWPQAVEETSAVASETCYGTSYYTAQRYYSSSISLTGNPYYGTNLNCYYQIRTYYSYDVVQLEVLNMTIEPYNDYLYLYDGLSSSYRTIASLTSTVQKRIFYSTQRYMTVRFSTNYRTTSSDIGFNVSYMSIEPGQHTTVASTISSTSAANDSCGNGHLYIYSDDVKIITSPGYPTSYYNSLSCNWQIYGYYPYVVQLIMLDISLESCCDKVHVYDGTNTAYPLLRTFTGTDRGIVHSTGYNMLVTFRTDSSVYYKGFQAVFALVQNQNCRVVGSNSTIATKIIDETKSDLIS